MVHCAIDDVVYIYQNYKTSVSLLWLTVVDATRRKRISDNKKTPTTEKTKYYRQYDA